VDELAQWLADFVQRRNERAFGLIVQRYVGLVYSSARRQLYDAHLAEEATQAVFIVLARKAGSIKSAGQLPGWLISTTRFVCKDLLKRQRRRENNERKAAPMNQEVRDSDLENIWEEMSPVLDEALSRLKEPERSAVTMRYLENREIAEVAAALGISRDAAAKRIERVLNKLRDRLASKGVVASSATMSAAMLAKGVGALPMHLSQASIATGLLAAKGLATGSAALLANSAIAAMSAKAKVMALAAMFAIALAGSLIWFALAQVRAAEPLKPGAIPASTASPIKVGVIVTENTSQPEYGAHGNEAIAAKLKDPAIDLYAIIDPGSADAPDVVEAMKQNFPPGHVIIGDNAQQLSKLNVIVACRAWTMRDEVLEALKNTVNDGVPLMYISQIGFQNPGMSTENCAALQGMTDVDYCCGPMGMISGTIVSNHPLLGKLRVGSKIQISHAMGPMGNFTGTPLIASPDMQGRASPSGPLESKPSEMAKWPTTQVSAGVFYPLLISQYGKGKIIGCGWHDPTPPMELDRANHGRFYIHCVQWLAGRELN